MSMVFESFIRQLFHICFTAFGSISNIKNGLLQCMQQAHWGFCYSPTVGVSREGSSPPVGASGAGAAEGQVRVLHSLVR